MTSISRTKAAPKRAPKTKPLGKPGQRTGPAAGPAAGPGRRVGPARGSATVAFGKPVNRVVSGAAKAKAAPMRASNSEGAGSPMARKLPAIKGNPSLRQIQGKQMSRGKGPLDGLAGLAKGVSRNFGAGVSEAARQLGNAVNVGPVGTAVRMGRKDPLAGTSLGDATRFGSTSTRANNPLKAILAPKK